MTLNELIQKLEEIRGAMGGDLPVVLSADSEGNSYGTLDADCSFENYPDAIIIYPYAERETLEEVISND